MNKDIIEGNWKIVKGKLKQQWAKFTDDDIEKMKGTYDEIRGRLQKLYGHDKERAEKELDEFIQKNKLQ
ncbi:MAG: CsbD family protein [Oligoflexia bacterium]|nr:CsbD family protein [Oligoflexia bacterium]